MQREGARQAGWTPVSMGEHILRTETAAIAAWQLRTRCSSASVSTYRRIVEAACNPHVCGPFDDGSSVRKNSHFVWTGKKRRANSLARTLPRGSSDRRNSTRSRGRVRS